MVAASDRIAALLVEEGADWAVLAGPEAVAFATGHVPGVETGPSPFSGGPTLALVSRDGAAGVVAANIEGDSGGENGVETVLYEGFSSAVTDVEGNYAAALRDLMTRLGVSGRLAGDRRHLTLPVADVLDATITDLSRPLDRLRAIKTEGEIKALERAATIASAGQDRARTATREGLAEVDVLNTVRAEMERLANGRCALAGEYLVGATRTARLGTQPGAARVRSHDPVICDLAPRVDGWWADSCGSFALGAGSDAYLEMWTAAREALDLAIDALRPGLRVSAFDALVRGRVRAAEHDYPHHTGHGIGRGVHEWPRLVPDEDALIEAGMVLMVEPGAYRPGLGGVRCEHMLLVTGTGCRPLTRFAMSPTVPNAARDEGRSGPTP